MGYRSSTRDQGYSLIELVVYVAVLAAFASLVVGIALTLGNVWGTARVNRALGRAGGDALERITREFRFARAIRPAGSAFNASPGALSLDTFTDPVSQATTTIRFSVSSNQLVVSEGGGPDVALTPSTVRVDSFTVWEVTPTARASTTRVELILTAGAGTKLQKTATFSATGVLRGSYRQ